MHTKSQELNDADKLNGLEWYGVFETYVKVARVYSPQHGWGAWSDRAPEGFKLWGRVQKSKGVWTFKPTDRGLMQQWNQSRKLDCAKLNGLPK